MKILRKSSEDEMISEYLKAEYTSARFSEKIKETIKTLSLNEKIILTPDLQNADENKQRKETLALARGYGVNQKMFERFPQITQWLLCSFSQDDLKNIRYIDYSYWNVLSGGTRLPIDAVKTINEKKFIYGQNNDAFIQAALHIKNGGTFPKMFFVTADFEKYVIAEGHLRMTGYAISPENFNDIEAIVGKCDAEKLKNWM